MSDQVLSSNMLERYLRKHQSYRSHICRTSNLGGIHTYIVRYFNLKNLQPGITCTEDDLLQPSLSVRVPVEVDGRRGAPKNARIARVLVRSQGLDNLAIIIVDVPLAKDAARLDLIADAEVEAGANSGDRAHCGGNENDYREAHIDF